MKYLLLLTLLISFTACQSNPSANTNTATPSPTFAQKTKIPFITPNQAISGFLKKEYPQWTLKGDTLDRNIEEIENEQFDVHLVKDQENKVITLIIKKFQTLEGEEYYQVFQAREIDLLKGKLKQYRKEVLADFSNDELDSEKKLSIVEDWNEEMSYQRWSGSYDSR